jgi:biopolymer transport protein ExbD
MNPKRSKRQRKINTPEVIMDVNTTPLIDVMLVLLVMLIITIPIQLHAVNLEMPVGVPPTQQNKPLVIQIDIDARNVIYWNGTGVTAEQLNSKMSEAAQMQVQPEIHLRPNKNCQYAIFANVLSSTKRIGLSKIAVIGSEQFVQ